MRRFACAFFLILSACSHDGPANIDKLRGRDLAGTDSDMLEESDAAAGQDSAMPAGDGGSQNSDGGRAGDLGSCGACDTPPDSCHALTGTCQAGTCVYAFVEGASCDDGNPCTVADICTGATCVGTPKTCDTPPAGACLSGTQAKTFDHIGSCNGGLCVYQSHTVTCGSGSCAGTACTGDACAGVVCDTPPSGCFTSPGVCSAGSCEYGFNDGASCNDNNACTVSDQCNTGACKGAPKACNSPPATSCFNSTTLKVFNQVGTCAPATGDCSYTFGFVSCPTGCSSGMCNPSGWTLMTSNTTNDLFSVWGSSSSAIWAVGASGTMVFYNGAQWQVRTTPSQAVGQDLHLITGTAANNVFLGAGSTLVRFNGTSWSKYGNLPATLVTGIFASGDANNDVYISTYEYSAGSPTPNLYVIPSSGTRSKVTSGPTADAQSSECYATGGGGVWAFSSTNILYAGCHPRQWNGASPSDFGGTASVAAEVMWAANPTAVFGVGAFGGFGGGSTIAIWDGMSWSNTPSGISGEISSLWGTAANRVFFAGLDGVNNKSAVIFYDGNGLVSETLPAAATHYLSGIWAAPTGEVFAVGSTGEIIQGP